MRESKVETLLGSVWERIIAQLLTYDLLRLDEDVLKTVYQELVDPKDRHDLGEYYTPDWLCELIVENVLPKSGWPKILDPTCGSGSFLRAAITHLLRANKSGSESTRLQSVLESVVGIDVHPLAVTISKATYVLALGKLVIAAKRPLQIPVYLADSLFLPAEVRQRELGQSPNYEIRFYDRRVSIPENVVHSQDLFDSAIAACSEVAIDHARSKKESPESLRAYLSKVAPHLTETDNKDDVLRGLWQFTKELADLIRAEKNSIWAFIVRNSYRPAMLREHFDYLIGNPPWLSYRYIADPEYQAEVKHRAIEEYSIAPKSQRLFTHMELATVFLAHCMATFAKPGAKLGFVMPRGILSADQHVNLRTRQYTAPFRLTGYWDLIDVAPLFRVPACVVFAVRADHGGAHDPLPVLEWRGSLPGKDVPLDVARESLVAEKATGQLIYLGERTALSTASGRTKPNDPSPYQTRFRQGATIVPRSLYFVRVVDLVNEPDPDKAYWAETDPEQAKDADEIYADVNISGSVEGRFIFRSVISKNLLPFVLLDLPTVVLPIVKLTNGFEMQTAADLRKRGDRGFARWMEKAEKIWDEKRAAKADRQTVYDRLNYQKELTNQDPSQRHLVLYNTSGTDLSVAYYDRNSSPLTLVVDHKLYWTSCGTREEAHYLIAVLNSDAVNQAIKPFQSMGLAGERDIHKKVLDLPIPSFAKSIQEHRDLAELGAHATEAARKFIEDTALPQSLARRRAALREHLTDDLRAINRLVKKLI